MRGYIQKLGVIFSMTIIFYANGCDGASGGSYNPPRAQKPQYHFLKFIEGNDKLLFIRYDQFFEGNDKLLFTRYLPRDFRTKGIFVYDIPSHKLYKPLSMNTVDYPSVPRFSRDNKQVAFVSDKNGGRNIYVMNANGGKVRQLTFSTGNSGSDSKVDLDIQTNDGPSFSPDGGRIIFKRSYALGRVRKVPILWDVFEIDIKTRKERKLTNIASFLMSDPFYFSDGEKFIFYFDKGDQGTGVYIADTKGGTPREITKAGWWIPGPRISWNDKIVFMGAYHDLFTYENGIIKKLNWIQQGILLTNLAISSDGSKVFFETETPKGSSKFERTLWIGNTDGTELQKINIPWDRIYKLD